MIPYPLHKDVQIWKQNYQQNFKKNVKTTTVYIRDTLAKEQSGGIATIFQSYICSYIHIHISVKVHNGRLKSDSLNK